MSTKSSLLLLILLQLASIVRLTIGQSLQANRPTLPALLAIVRYQNTACQGVQQDSGTCLADAECARRAGQSIGSCANGFASCCSFKFTCGAKTNQNETTFVNPSYPKFDNGTQTCQVTVEKSANICQIRLDFDEFKLSQPDENGLCTTDSFMVRTTVGERLPILCGENGGQHLYVDMGRESANPIVLSMVTNGDKFLRKWKIKISAIACNNLDMAPSGCMQYFKSPTAIVKSFNYGPRIEGRARYLSNLRYTACVRVEQNFCAIKWENEYRNSFSFGVESLTNSNKQHRAFNQSSDESNQSQSAALCNSDDFIGVNQASADGMGSGEDRFCGTRLSHVGHIISRSKPFDLKVRTNSEHSINVLNSQVGFSLRYVQLPCVV